MQKEIEVVDYLREVAMTLTETFQHDIPSTTLEANARIFFNIFGINTAEVLVGAYDNELGWPQEAYKCLFVLYKEMGNDDAEFFIKMLRQGINDMKEKVSD